MRSYSETDVFTDYALEAFREASQLLARIADPAPGVPAWRCHEVARAVRYVLHARPGKVKLLDVVDGKFSGADHSWLEIARGTTAGWPALLDVYAVGSLPMVQLLDTTPLLGGRKALYEQGEERDDISVGALEALIEQMKR